MYGYTCRYQTPHCNYLIVYVSNVNKSGKYYKNIMIEYLGCLPYST